MFGRLAVYMYHEKPRNVYRFWPTQKSKNYFNMAQTCIQEYLKVISFLQ